MYVYYAIEFFIKNREISCIFRKILVHLCCSWKIIVWRHLSNMTVDVFSIYLWKAGNDLHCWYQNIAMWLKKTSRTKDPRPGFVNHKITHLKKWKSTNRQFTNWKINFDMNVKFTSVLFKFHKKIKRFFAFFMENSITQPLYNTLSTWFLFLFWYFLYFGTFCILELFLFWCFLYFNTFYILVLFVFWYFLYFSTFCILVYFVF